MLDKKDWKALCEQLEIAINELPDAVIDVIPDDLASSMEDFEQECARRASGAAYMSGSDVVLLRDAQARLLASGFLLSKLSRRAPDPALLYVLKMLGDAQCSLAAILQREVRSDAFPERVM